jgi:glycosyltransferase involved in cell wall biosynthesis
MSIDGSIQQGSSLNAMTNSVEFQMAGSENPAVDERLRASYSEGQYQVICVCGGLGFPISASAKRIVNVGRALIAAGIHFRVLHCGPTPLALNDRRSGVYFGIPFQYTTWLKRPTSKLIRIPTYVWGLVNLMARLVRASVARHRTAVYLYAMDGPLALSVGLVCKVLGIPVVQEMCEWFPVHPNRGKFTRWLYRGPIFANATGLLAISTLIERLVRDISESVNPRLRIHLLPSVVDARPIVDAPAPRGGRSGEPRFVWCGVGYINDVHFMVRVLALLHREGHPCRLRLISAVYAIWTPDSLRGYALEQGLSPDALEFTGALDDAALIENYKSATALLLPMWDNDQSKARIPNKLAEYMAAGRPVITSAVGDLAAFLQHGVNAYLGGPGSERDFADNMLAVMEDPARAARIGAAGQKTCLERLDFRYRSATLSRFFVECIENKGGSDVRAL